jgi:hypothetical protein
MSARRETRFRTRRADIRGPALIVDHPNRRHRARVRARRVPGGSLARGRRPQRAPALEDAAFSKAIERGAEILDVIDVDCRTLATSGSRSSHRGGRQSGPITATSTSASAKNSKAIAVRPEEGSAERSTSGVHFSTNCTGVPATGTPSIRKYRENRRDGRRTSRRRLWRRTASSVAHASPAVGAGDMKGWIWR